MDKRPLKVFLCHASVDKPRVRELYRTLKRRGVQPWLDAEDLIPGQNWEVEIPKALYSSDAIIICLTPNSVDKEGYVQKEIKFALDKAMEMPEGRIFIIPARLEDCNLPFSLRQYQAVNLYEKAGYTKLMQALKLRASQLERSTVELPKVGETTAEIKKVIEEKKPPEPEEDKTETKTPKPSKVGVGGDVNHSVIVAGSRNVINFGNQEKPALEKPQPKKTKSPHKPNTAIIVALIGLAGTIIAALVSSPMIEKWFSPISSQIPNPTTVHIVQQTLQGQTLVAQSSPTKSFIATTTLTPVVNFTSTIASEEKLAFNMAYISVEDGNFSLNYLNTNREKNKLLDGFDFIDSPVISHDGKSIVFATLNGIYSVDVVNNSVRRHANEGQKPMWSPDDQNIVFETNGTLERPGCIASDGSVIGNCTDLTLGTPFTQVLSEQLIIFVSADQEIVLGLGPNPGYRGLRGLLLPRWSFNGEKFSYVSRQNVDFLCVDDYPREYFVDPNCYQMKGVINSYNWSPTSDQIAVSSLYKGKNDIYLFDIKSSNLVNVTSGEGNNFSPIWNHAGDKIAFVSDRSGDNEIYVINSTGTLIINLTQNTSSDFSPLWTPDDKSIVFVSDRSGNLNIYQINVESGETINLVNDVGDKFSPSIIEVKP